MSEKPVNYPGQMDHKSLQCTCALLAHLQFLFFPDFVYITRLEYYDFHLYFDCALSKKGYLNSESNVSGREHSKNYCIVHTMQLLSQHICSFWLLPAILLRNVNR